MGVGCRNGLLHILTSNKRCRKLAIHKNHINIKEAAGTKSSTDTAVSECGGSVSCNEVIPPGSIAAATAGGAQQGAATEGGLRWD